MVFYPFVVLKKSYTNLSSFEFLNLKKHFEEGAINWNYKEYGKLWTYNLNYFDFLHQDNLTKEEGLTLIKHYIKEYDKILDGKEPAPTAIRLMNWIKFISVNNIDDQNINKTIWCDTYRLKNNLEYHLLGNHLLENAFGLLFSAYYFRDGDLYQLASKLLKRQLNEQILNDGAHFELSTMYHQLMLLRVLDAKNLVVNNLWIATELNSILEQKAQLMLAWLKEISFKNNDLPLINDAANHVFPNVDDMIKYSNRLNITPITTRLKDCGYRKIVNENFECLIDVGQIGPSYQPGHAHADTFNFLLYSKAKHILVDTGITTYEVNNRRQYERSTKAHNTVVVNGINSSDVWAGFRVAKRAKILKLIEKEHQIISSHDGYKNINTIHNRSWTWTNDSLEIFDLLETKHDVNACAYLHFSHDVEILKLDDFNYKCDHINLTFKNAHNVQILKCQYGNEFNHFEDALMMEILFTNKLTTSFQFN